MASPSIWIVSQRRRPPCGAFIFLRVPTFDRLQCPRKVLWRRLARRSYPVAGRPCQAPPPPFTPHRTGEKQKGGLRCEAAPIGTDCHARFAGQHCGKPCALCLQAVCGCVRAGGSKTLTEAHVAAQRTHDAVEAAFPGVKALYGACRSLRRPARVKNRGVKRRRACI